MKAQKSNGSVKKLAKSLEEKLNSNNILNLKYGEQNFYMQKEMLKHAQGTDKNGASGRRKGKPGDSFGADDIEHNST